MYDTLCTTNISCIALYKSKNDTVFLGLLLNFWIATERYFRVMIVTFVDSADQKPLHKNMWSGKRQWEQMSFLQLV